MRFTVNFASYWGSQIKGQPQIFLIHLIFILVDLQHCHFKSVENVITWMSCDTSCFSIGGVQDIYNPGPNGFGIYPHKDRDQTLTVEEIQSWGAEVHYQVTGDC